jgi:hypothetical protein
MSLDQIYLAAVLVLSILFGAFGLIKAPNDAQSIATYLATAGGVASVAAAFFTVPIWIVVQVAG